LSRAAGPVATTDGAGHDDELAPFSTDSLLRAPIARHLWTYSHLDPRHSENYACVARHYVRPDLAHTWRSRDEESVRKAGWRQCRSVELSAGSGDPAYNQESTAFSLVGRVPSRGVDGLTDQHWASAY